MPVYDSSNLEYDKTISDFGDCSSGDAAAFFFSRWNLYMNAN